MIRKESIRDIYGKELVKLAKNNSNIIVLDADLSTSTKTNYFEEEIPNRFFEMGIAEANMVSVAAGLSLNGFIPFVNTFSVFLTGRAYDQIRQGIAVPKLNVKLIGSSCGLSDFADGATHQSIEDIAIMRALPNMVVLVPVDSYELVKILYFSINYNGPVYIRLTRSLVPIITDENDPFSLGKMNVIAEGDDISIFACGVMVEKALESSNLLLRENISMKVINVSTIKPIDPNEVKKHITKKKYVITAEEHSIIGGLGSAILEALEDEPIILRRIGVNDIFGQSASNYDELMNFYNLSAKNIVNCARNFFQK
jgi:transketolase